MNSNHILLVLSEGRGLCRRVMITVEYSPAKSVCME